MSQITISKNGRDERRMPAWELVNRRLGPVLAELHFDTIARTGPGLRILEQDKCDK
jgi:hypothetical protein